MILNTDIEEITILSKEELEGHIRHFNDKSTDYYLEDLRYALFPIGLVVVCNSVLDTFTYLLYMIWCRPTAPSNDID